MRDLHKGQGGECNGPASLSLDSSRAQQRSPMILKLLLKKRLRDKRREIQQRNSTINRVCPSQVETQSTHAGGEEKEVNAWVRVELGDYRVA